MFMFLGTSPQSIVEALLALRLFMFLILLMFLDPCNSFQVVSLSTLVVWSFLTLALVLIRILTQMLYLLWAPRRYNYQALYELDWLHLPSDDTVASLSASPRLPTLCGIIHCLGHSCGSRLSSFVRCCLIGYVSRGVSLDSQVCRLCKQVKLPFLRINPTHPPMMILYC